MRSYSQLVIRTCHNRGVHAMGGMAAQIPIKDDPVANEAAMAKVRADKEREATDGHDGTWVAHPALVAVAKEIFDRVMPASNQIHRRRQDVAVTAADLLKVPEGSRTEAGLRQNIVIGVVYVEAWLRGIGCVPLNHLMEDAATAEISRAQIWQQLHHGAKLEDGPGSTARCSAACSARRWRGSRSAWALPSASPASRRPRACSATGARRLPSWNSSRCRPMTG